MRSRDGRLSEDSDDGVFSSFDVFETATTSGATYRFLLQTKIRLQMPRIIPSRRALRRCEEGGSEQYEMRHSKPLLHNVVLR